MTREATNLKRTHMCGGVTAADIGNEIVLTGWVQKQRNLGGLIFVSLRDRAGIVQVVFNDDVLRDIFTLAESLRSEFVIAVTGVVAKRAPENINTEMKTGEIEVIASSLSVLNEAETTPIYIEEDLDANEAIRLKYRYLDLRRPDMQRIFIARHKIAKAARDYFDTQGFLEIETPMLTKSTPEGARDYLVPSRVHPGKFFALPQSPQLFKQLLMIAGYDRYFQIAKCFRDEDLRADRQPDFTQIDLEMSFVDMRDVMEINEGFVKNVFKDVLDMEVATPFVQMPYQEAMERYGSDKPDTRFGYELIDVSETVRGCGFKVFADTVENGGSVRAINVKEKAEQFRRKEIDGLVEFVKECGAKGLAWLTMESDGTPKSSIAKFFSEEQMQALLQKLDATAGDIVFFVADKDKIVFDALGRLRLKVADKLDVIDKKAFHFLWVTEFPLFDYDEEEDRAVAVHHPFTAPMDEDIALLDSAPLKARSKAYDLVLNGNELGGGSIRIHTQEVQAKMFEKLGFTEQSAKERFGFLLDALKYGTPPHGGMAYGLDRLVMLMTGRDNIRDVIAFPKVQTSACLMTEAPSFVDEKQLDELGLSRRPTPHGRYDYKKE